MKNRKLFNMITLIPLVLGITSLLVAPYVDASQKDELSQRLDNLSKVLEQKRQAYHIPGMAIAVVKDNKVIFAKGYGFSNLETKTPVTTETLFAIGSSSKAFTSTIVGMMVDEGKLDWDAPITDYLPYFKFNLNNKKDHMTLRDLLSHRSGYSRNDILWVNGKVGREEILKDATHAEPMSEFRKKFNYNNVMFLAAGMAAARKSGIDWDSLLSQRLLKPLGMNHTTSLLNVAKKDPNLSLGYMWLDEQKKYRHLPMRNLANIAPAGAINSNVLDMTHWLRFQLDHGRFNHKRLISDNNLQQTRTSQIKIANNVDYGMGWFLRKWHGKKVVEHGGNIDGFGAQVAFIPEENLGFVLLTNVTATPLQQESMSLVWDHLLSKKEKNQQQNLSQSGYADYIGDYIANFGSFKNVDFTFSVKDGKPYINVPGQMNYELKAPDKDGRMLFAITDTISVSFDKNERGKIVALRMHQNGFDFELQRKGVPIVAEEKESDFKPFLGLYQSKLFKGNLEVKIQNHRLAIDVPNQMVFELSLPDENGTRHFRVRPLMKVTFDNNNNNQITAVNVYKGEKKLDTARRTNMEKIEKLPSLKEILALRSKAYNKNAFIKNGGVLITGNVALINAGITGKITLKMSGNDRLFSKINLGKYGFITTAFNANSGALDQSFSPFNRLVGKYLVQAQLDHPATLIAPQDFYKDIEVVGITRVSGKKVYELVLKHEKVLPRTIFVDASNGDILMLKATLLLPNIGSMPVTTTYSDYRDVEGVRLPFRTRIESRANGKLDFLYKTIKFHQKFNDSEFSLKEPLKKAI